MKVTFLGVRGSAPVSGGAFAEFGGDTPSVSIETKAERILLDAGSGLRSAPVNPGADSCMDLILSHFHFDHLIGLPFFPFVWQGQGRLRLWAPEFAERDAKAMLDRLFSTPLCPVGLGDFRTPIDLRPFSPGDAWRIGEVAVATRPGEHPDGSSIIRIESNGASLVYATDIELRRGRQFDELVEFAQGVDLLIIDAMNNDENSPSRSGWGHSSWREATLTGVAARARHIGLFHHDPQNDDHALRQMEASAKAVDGRAFAARQNTSIAL